jgi:hypothetical protein
MSSSIRSGGEEWVGAWHACPTRWCVRLGGGLRYLLVDFDVAHFPLLRIAYR